MLYSKIPLSTLQTHQTKETTVDLPGRVNVQFGFTNIGLVPMEADSLGVETPSQRANRLARRNGGNQVLILDEVDQADALPLMEHLMSHLAVARPVHQIRDRSQNVRFSLNGTGVEDGFYRNSLLQLLTSAAWRIRIYEVRGQDGTFWNVVLDKRFALIDGNGSKVRVWEKDEEGNRIGDKPLPVAPSSRVVWANDQVQVLPW